MQILIQPDRGPRPSSYDLHLRARQLRSEAFAAGPRKVRGVLDNRTLADIGFEREQRYVQVRSGRVRRLTDIQR